MKNNKIEDPNGVRFFGNKIDVEKKWLSSEQAANYLSISPSALRIMVHREQIKYYKIGRRLRFRLCDCESLFQKKGD